MKKFTFTLCVSLSLALLAPVPSFARVDLVTLPARDKVQLTIYNSADLTLVRDIRTLTMRNGPNRLQFGWSGTLIDPTSLEMMPQAEAGNIQVQSLEYPPRIQGLGIWNLDSEMSGEVPFEITYFTSGISWQAYYMATLTPDESAMRLNGYVRVNNNSGEDYENAETRLIVGKINLLDRIADLARRAAPYGKPGPGLLPMTMEGVAADIVQEAAPVFYAARSQLKRARPKEIRKEGLSEYFLYTIEGTEDIANGWGKRLISFSAPKIPVRNLYRYDEQKYGQSTVRFISFANDEDHRLGKEPIPGGLVKVFRDTGKDGLLSYVGARQTRYIPKGEEVNLDLGPSRDVSVKTILMDYRTDKYEWKDDSITGWDEHRTVKVKADNYRDTPVLVEIRRNFPVKAWELENGGSHGRYEKVDADTVQYTMELDSHESRIFKYDVIWHRGSRGNR
ncbi:hypothetical protein BMS3Abin14_02231 [bacterium BMS3Abin14]|nr:hypothetical protein BMS3Abin14_02231 [bacterium BMS3Abin14]